FAWVLFRCVLLRAWVVFFFQAEDGIRAFHVTGVQTCALPIFLVLVLDAELLVGADVRGLRPQPLVGLHPLDLRLLPRPDGLDLRSEERRVGRGFGPRRAR